MEHPCGRKVSFSYFTSMLRRSYRAEVEQFALDLGRDLEYALRQFEGLCDWLRYRNGVLDINAEFPPECLGSIDKIFHAVSRRNTRAPVRRIQEIWKLRPCDLVSYFGNDALGSLNLVRQLATLASTSNFEDAKRLLQRYRCARREGRAFMRGSSRCSRWTATDVAQAIAESRKARDLQHHASSSKLKDSGDPPGLARDAERVVCEAVKLLDVSAAITRATSTPSSELLGQLSRVARSSTPSPDTHAHEAQHLRNSICSSIEPHIVEREKRRGFRSPSSKSVQSLQPGYWLHEDAIMDVLQCVRTQAEDVCLVPPGFLTLGEPNNMKDKKLRELNRESHRLVMFPMNVDGYHWIIAFLDLEMHSVSAYDPLQVAGTVRRACDLLLTFVDHSPTFRAVPRSLEKVSWHKTEYQVG